MVFIKRKIVPALLALVFMLPLSSSSANAVEKNSAQKPGSMYDKYYDYRYGKTAANRPDHNIIIKAASFDDLGQDTDIDIKQEYSGRNNVVLWKNEQGWIEWQADIPEEGFYNIALGYYPVKSKGRDIEFELHIDGSIPFEGAMKLLFNRIWMDEGDIEKDNKDNELRPKQIERPQWLEKTFGDSEGLVDAPYEFYFTKGVHTIRLKLLRESLALDYIKIFNKGSEPVYEKIYEQYGNLNYNGGHLIKIQAEDTYVKSHAVLHPIYDKSSPKTEPYHPSKIRMNTIGGENWKYPSQYITWEFDIPEDGLYKIGMRYRQNFVRGFYTSRRLYIDGKVPFREMNQNKFSYGINWNKKVLGDKEPYLFYLEKGRHELTLEVTLGDIAESVYKIQEMILSLNDIYRKIIMITSVQPDLFRDYYLEKQIPDLITSLNGIENELRNEALKIENATGQKGSEAVLLERVSEQLESLAKEPDTIPERLTKFKDNIASLSALALKIKEQPLELDYIMIASPEKKFPAAKANIVQKVIHEIRAFFGSFFEDYTNIGNVSDKSERIDVWLGLGRDQAYVLKGMIDDMFTPQTGIDVNLSLVQGALLQAVMAGKGPDVALNVGRGEPVNLALRGALVPLDDFDGFEEVTHRFMDDAMLPYEFNGHYYALPETQVFFMMFYRKDIFNELGIQVPETWEDMYRIVPKIQASNMNIGLPYVLIDAYSLLNMGMGAQSIFPTILLQQGETFYNNEHSSTNLDSPAVLEAFKEWTEFYTRYGIPLFKDDYSRFRIGEMPIVISQYPFYNLLTVAAPEIRNLWEMVLIPGVLAENGEIDRSTSASGTGSIIIDKNNKNKDASWEFLKWWTSAEVQARFGNEIETVMGPAGRYTPANVEALDFIPWSYKESDLIKEQWGHVIEIPEVPGGYYTQRNLDNAFRATVFRYENPREMLNYWNREINEEIERKRIEFGLD